MHDLFTKFQKNPSSTPLFFVRHGILFRKDIIYIPNFQQFKAKVLDYIHSNPHTGHSRFHKYLLREKVDFYWLGMKHDVKQIFRDCDTYQRNKLPHTFLVGLLQLLQVPQDVWIDLSIDFVEGLLLSNGYSLSW